MFVFERGGLCGGPERSNQFEPRLQAVPSGENLGHHPSLPCNLAGASVGKPTFWRRLSTVARSAKVDGWQATRPRSHSLPYCLCLPRCRNQHVVQSRFDFLHFLLERSLRLVPNALQ